MRSEGTTADGLRSVVWRPPAVLQLHIMPLPAADGGCAWSEQTRQTLLRTSPRLGPGSCVKATTVVDDVVDDDAAS